MFSVVHFNKSFEINLLYGLMCFTIYSLSMNNCPLFFDLINYILIPYVWNSCWCVGSHFVFVYMVGLNSNDYIVVTAFDCGLLLISFHFNFYKLIFWYTDSVPKTRGVCYRLCSIQGISWLQPEEQCSLTTRGDCNMPFCRHPRHSLHIQRGSLLHWRSLGWVNVAANSW